jgi:hypothetical protein
MSRGRICVPAGGERGMFSVSSFHRRVIGEQRGTDCLRGDNVVPLLLVESRYALDDHVVALCSTRGEDDILFFCPNKVRYVL